MAPDPPIQEVIAKPCKCDKPGEKVWAPGGAHE